MSPADRRPPTLHRGPASAQAPRPPAGAREIAFLLTDRRVVTLYPPAEKAERELQEMVRSIADGRPILLNDPSGSTTVLNPAHIVSVELR